MSKKVVNIGSTPNDGTGDSLRDGMGKINENFTEIYNTFGNGTTLDISSIGDATTLDGQDGSYYLNYNNFTNTPNDLSVFNNSVGFVTANIVDGYATETYVTNSLVGYATETYVDSGLSLKANLTGANFIGVVTASQFVGDGSGLTGITAIGTGIEIEDDGSPVGTAATINFGSNINIAISAGVATANVQVPQVYFDSNATGIHTLSNVGIGTTNAESKLTVSGDVKITGVTTITGNYFYVGNANTQLPGTSGVILDTSGKVIHQSVGGETHIEGYAGSSLSYALSKDGNLYLGGGNPDDGGTGGNISILGQTSRIGIGSTLPEVSLDINGDARISGILTVGSSSITLDGQNDIITVGTGVTIYGNTGIVSATDLYASQLQVSTITADTIIYEGSTLYNSWQKTDVGIHTLSNVGIGTTNPTSALTVKGNTSLETLNVSGIATFNNIVYVGSDFTITRGASTTTLNSSTASGTLRLANNTFGGTLELRGDSVSLETSSGGDKILVGQSGAGVTAYYNGLKKFETIGAGVTVTGTTFTNQLSVSGVSTFIGGVFANDIFVGDYDRIFFGNNSNFTIGYDAGNGESLIRNQTSAPFAIDLASNANSTLTIKNNAYTLGFFSRTNVELYNSGTKRFETIGTGVTVTGTTFTNQLNVSGVSTFNGSDNYFSGNIICSSYAGPSRIILTGGTGGDTNFYNGGTSYSDFIFTAFQGGSSREIARINKNGILSLPYAGGGLNVVGVSTFVDNVGIGTTNASSKLTVRGGDISVGVSTAHGVILTSPNGTQFRLIVDDSGNLSTVAV